MLRWWPGIGISAGTRQWEMRSSPRVDASSSPCASGECWPAVQKQSCDEDLCWGVGVEQLSGSSPQQAVNGWLAVRLQGRAVPRAVGQGSGACGPVAHHHGHREYLGQV